jgi:hypothetical protein
VACALRLAVRSTPISADEPSAKRSRNNAMDLNLSEEERSHAAIAAILAARCTRD